MEALYYSTFKLKYISSAYTIRDWWGTQGGEVSSVLLNRLLSLALLDWETLIEQSPQVDSLVNGN